MTGIQIRPARIDDAQDMIDVINPLIRAGGTTANEVEYSLEAQRDFLTGLGPRAGCVVAVDEVSGAVVGFQSYERHSRLPDDVADIATFVHLGEKGRGVGRLLSDTTFKAARENGYSEINATIRADNFEGLAFYTRIGFRDVLVDRAVPLNSGKIVDRISKRRVL